MPLGGRAALYYGWYAMPEGALRFASPDVTILNGSLGSNLPDDLRGLGYDVRKIGDGERILPHAITEGFVRRADGELEPLTANSTKPIASTVTHAGIVKTKQKAPRDNYSLSRVSKYIRSSYG
jgi:hypothetical protein